jgi:mannonate dehydratase
MKQTWRWFGPDDPVTLAHARQAGATGIVTALHQLNDGRIWPHEEVARRKAIIENAGLVWSVVESIIVHEDIKTRTGRYRELIDNYKASIRAVADHGIRTICYNFMAITDWTRTDLDYRMRHGGTALRFDTVEFCAYDVLILKRPGAENDHPAERIAKARDRLACMSESDLARLERNLIEWVPAREFVYDRQSLMRMLDAYRDLTPEGFRGNLIEFLREIIPVAEEVGVRMAIHPDDPPFPLFGLPRVVCNVPDARALLAAVPSSSNGLTLCTGSYGANPANDLVAMAREFGASIHFAHLRNVTKEPDGSFHEAEHLDGDIDMVGVVVALMAEERRRRAEGRTDDEIPMRPDHGHAIVDDIGKRVNPGYSCVGRLKGLAELRGVMRTIDAMALKPPVLTLQRCLAPPTHPDS